MKKFLGRLFILTPLIVLSLISILCLIIPFIIWLFSGRDYIEDVIDFYDDIKEKIENKGWA